MNGSALVKHAVVAGLCLSGAARVMASPPPDADIAVWVRSALRHDHHVDPAGIEVKVEKGVVTLSGSAHSLATKQRALDDAKKIDGVVGVVDKLGVSAPWRPDADIALDVRSRLVHNQMIESRHIGVTSDGGAVALTGIVGSWAELQEAGILAAEVRGVRAVENELAVQYAGSRGDDEVRKDVEAKLDLDVYLNGLSIKVAVKGGVVTLSGSVGSHFEKDRAGREVRYLAHVKRLDNELKVERWENRGTRTAAPGPVSDKDLARHVKSVIGMDSRIASSKVDVSAQSGHVTLRGSVSYGFQKRMAEQDARDTIGVALVTNELLVPGVHREDASLRSDILASLDSDYLLSGMDVTVQAKDGHVTLGGYVNDNAQQAHAEEIATRIIGVKSIRNNVKVERDRLSDMAVAREVRNRLSHNWLTAGAHDYISVACDDGTVTLTGEVGTWSVRAEAARVALRTAGVWSVHNRLTVNGVAYPWDEWDEKITFFSPYYWVWY